MFDIVRTHRYRQSMLHAATRSRCIRMGMSVNAGGYSLAMLDEAGIVVSWHDDISPDQSAGGLLDDVIDDHVRQFYVLADVVADVPRRDLRVAAVKGTCIGQGWRRRLGDDWKCDRGFRRDDQECVAIKIPHGAYLDGSGSDWRCDRGFQRSSSACVALLIPANAHIDYSGNDWACDSGFDQRGTGCVASIPR